MERVNQESKTGMKKHLIAAIFLIWLNPLLIGKGDGSAVGHFFKATGSPVNPKAEISWNRYYTNEGLFDFY